MLRFVSMFFVLFSSLGFSLPLTYENCFTSKQIAAIPQRILPIDINATEIALALGLESQMIATAGVSDPELVLAEYRQAFLSLPSLSPSYPNALLVSGSGTDLVIAGWNAGFFTHSSLTPEALEAKGIGSYTLRETCSHVGAKGIPTLFTATFIDIETIARLTGREEVGARLIAAMQKRLVRVRRQVDQYARPEPATVFVYDSGMGIPYTAGVGSVLSDVIASAGGHNVAKDIATNWGMMNWDKVVTAAPEVIMIVDYGFGDGLRKQRLLLSKPELQSVPAIRLKNFFITPYSAALSGVRSVGLTESFADHLICSFSPYLNQGVFTCSDQQYSLVD